MSKYFVFNPDKSKPKKLYDSFEEAQKDAQSVANKYDKCTVYILEVAYEIVKKEWVRQEKFARGTLVQADEWEKIPF